MAVKMGIVQQRKFSRLLMVVILCFIGFFVLKDAGAKLNSYEDFKTTRHPSAVREYTPFNNQQTIDSLKVLYGKNKHFIDKYELQTLLALSHYPELKNVSIHFYEQKSFIPLISRPELLSMLGNKNKWQYNIIISTESTEDLEPVLLGNLPFNAQVGIMGHELAHTVFYLDKSVWQMLLIGLNYPLPSFRANFEKNTDRRAIAHGLGEQLLDYARFARKVMPYDDTYLGSEYYLSPQEIRKQMGIQLKN